MYQSLMTELMCLFFWILKPGFLRNNLLSSLTGCHAYNKTHLFLSSEISEIVQHGEWLKKLAISVGVLKLIVSTMHCDADEDDSVIDHNRL